MAADAEEIRKQLLDEIASAFADVRLEDGVSLHQARARDDYQPESEIARVRQYDREERWDQISNEKIERFNDTLSFMDPKGYRFHLPRFMVYALERYRTSDSHAADAAAYSFVYRRDEVLTPYHEARRSLLNDRQRRVIARFLHFLAEHADKGYADDVAAREALDRYWSRYL